MAGSVATSVKTEATLSRARVCNILEEVLRGGGDGELCRTNTCVQLCLYNIVMINLWGSITPGGLLPDPSRNSARVCMRIRASASHPADMARTISIAAVCGIFAGGDAPPRILMRVQSN